MKSKIREERAITLIALIITVIVMLILAFVTMNSFIGDNGIFKKASQGAEIYKNAANNEAESLNNLDKKVGEIVNRIDGGQQTNGKEISIDIHLSHEGSKLPVVGMQISVYKYADIEANGNIRVCEDFERLELFSIDKIEDEFLTNERFFNMAEIIEKENEAIKMVYNNVDIKPILTTTVKEQTEKITLKSNQLDNAIWFVVFEGEEYEIQNDEDGKEWIRVKIAKDEQYEYNMKPCIGTCLTKNGKGLILGEANLLYDEKSLTFDGYFLYEIVLKKGSLEILTNLNNYKQENGAVTFEYEVKVQKDGQEVYSDVVNSTFNASGQQSIPVEDIPIGSQVTVQAIYSGNAYICTSEATQIYTQTSTDTNLIEFTYE